MATQVSTTIGMKAPDFTLPATDGRTYSLNDIAGEKGTVVAFISNHCPYVKSSVDRMVADAAALEQMGVGFVAICANDAVSHPDDSFDNMKLFAERHGFGFPYLHDESQEVARAYDAACTPEYHGLDAAGTVVYLGRLDEGRTEAPPPGAKRELVDAMQALVETGSAPTEQIPSMGCSIKWKAG